MIQTGIAPLYGNKPKLKTATPSSQPFALSPHSDIPMNIDPSSPLHALERHNYSRSTVGSSDTDVDSIGYASSSGTTTPEDDAQEFHLGPTLQSVLADKSKLLLREKPTVAMKHRNLSLAVKRVKRVAHALVVLRKKKCDDVSASPLRERFGKRMAVKPHPEEGFYSLPNRRFSFSDISTPSHRHYQETITRKFGTISGSASGFSKDTPRKPRSGPRMPSFSDLQPSAVSLSTTTPESRQTGLRSLTFKTICFHVLRALLFVPWCVTVGGALVLFPNYVELVAFGPGYLPSPKGIRRFAHWAECGQQHVLIFLASLIVVLWHNHALGLSLASIIMSRLAYVWHDFKVDASIPLGDDDQQSLYLVVTGLASADGSFRMCKPGGETVKRASPEA